MTPRYGGRSGQQEGILEMLSGVKDLWMKSGMGLLNPNNPVYENSRKLDERQKFLLSQGIDPLSDDTYKNLLINSDPGISLDPGGAGLMAGKIASKAIKPLATAQDVIEARARQMDLKPKDRIEPSGKDPLFELTPEAYERTQGLLKQERLEPPKLLEGETKYPGKDRIRPLVDRLDEVAEIIAEKSRPALGTETQYFYNMGPVYEGLLKKGYSRQEILDFFNEFGAGYGAGSPKTATEPNLLTAFMLRSKDARGKDLRSIEGPGTIDPKTGKKGKSEKGFPYMDLHANIYKDFIKGVDRMGTNPKPTNFMEGARGNLQTVTADSHAIRGALVAQNELAPGSISRNWFKTGPDGDKGYQMYLDDPMGFMSDPNKIANKHTGIQDGLIERTKNKKKERVEYSVFQELYERVAEKLGVTPAEAQSLAWFSSGANTNLRSAPKSIPRILDERIDVTAQALGLTKDQVLDLVVRNKLPLMGVGMAGLLNVPEEGQN